MKPSTLHTMNLIFILTVIIAVVTGIYAGFNLNLEPLKTGVLAGLTIFGGSFIYRTFKNKVDAYCIMLGIEPAPGIGDFIGAFIFYFGAAYGITELFRWIFG